VAIVMRKKLRRALLVLLVLLLLALLPVAYYLYRQWTDARELAEVIAELDRDEPGWRLADLMARRPALADDKNAATVLKQARLPTPRTWNVSLQELKLVPNQALTPLQTAKLREYLDQAETNLLEARRLVDFPAGRFEVKIAPDFISTAIPHVQDLRDLCNLLHMDAVWQAQQANFERVVEDVHATRNAARALRDEPFLISHLVRLAILSEAAAVLERTVAQGQQPPKLLERMQRLLADERAADSWFNGIEGERAGLHELFMMLNDNSVHPGLVRALTPWGDAPPGHWPEALTDYLAALSARQSHAWMLRNFTAQLAARDLPEEKRRARVQELLDENEKAPAIAKMLMSPQWKKTSDAFWRGEAKLRAAAAALAAERFRHKHERWPKTLDELVPAWLAKIPADPFADGPLRYRATKDGVVIYSVGPEAKNNGDSRDAADMPGGQQPDAGYEFRLWNVDQRRRPGQDP
jgi:hypothetical protein